MTTVLESTVKKERKRVRKRLKLIYTDDERGGNKKNQIKGVGHEQFGTMV